MREIRHGDRRTTRCIWPLTYRLFGEQSNPVLVGHIWVEVQKSEIDWGMSVQSVADGIDWEDGDLLQRSEVSSSQNAICSLLGQFVCGLIDRGSNSGSRVWQNLLKGDHTEGKRVQEFWDLSSWVFRAISEQICA